MEREISYQEVEPLIQACKAINGRVYCSFRCLRTHFVIASSAELANSIADGSEESYGTNLRWSLWSKARQALGSVQSPKVARNVEVEQAVVIAFRGIQDHFEFKGGEWIAKAVEQDYRTEFVLQLQEAPIELEYDRFILARLLSQIAAADGDYDAAEMEFVRSFAPSGFDAWEQAPDKDELLEVSPKVRKSILMLCWSIAFSNVLLDPKELVILMTIAGAFGLDAEDLQCCKLWAQEQLVDQGFESAYADAEADRHTVQQTYLLGRRLGLTQENIERLDERCRKRLGRLE